jgi:hypothetical protein
MLATRSREKAIVFASAAVILLLFCTAAVHGKPSSLHLLFTGGATIHLEPSG